MSSVIQVTPNKNGRAIIQLYGKDYDVTNIVGKDGRGSFEAFGETHQFELFPSTTAMKKVAASQKSKNEETEVKNEA